MIQESSQSSDSAMNSMSSLIAPKSRELKALCFFILSGKESVPRALGTPLLLEAKGAPGKR